MAAQSGAIAAPAMDTGHDMPLPLSASVRRLSQMHGQRTSTLQRTGNHQRGMLLR